MNSKIWKKNAVLATVILFVCVAVYLNWSYGRDTAAAAEVSPSPSPAVTQTGESLPSNDDAAVGSAALSGDGLDTLETSGDTPDNSTAVSAEANEYFAEARLNREQARASSIEILRESGAVETASQEARDEAVAAANVIAVNALTEAEIEGLVTAKGFADCVVYISENGVDVVVAAPEGGLFAEQVSQIKDIVLSKTDVPIENVRIVGV